MLKHGIASSGNVGWEAQFAGTLLVVAACRTVHSGKCRVSAGAPPHAPRLDFGVNFVRCGVSVAEVGAGGGMVKGLCGYASTRGHAVPHL